MNDYKTVFLWAKFIDDGTTARINVRINKEIGEIVFAQHLDGAIYDCSIVSQDNDYVYIKKLKFNELFYNQIQKLYNQYNLKNNQ